MGDIRDVIKKSRNAKSRINYEHKTRIFAEDKKIGVRSYMMKHFGNLIQADFDAEDSPSPENSPVKGDPFDKKYAGGVPSQISSDLVQ